MITIRPMLFSLAISRRIQIFQQTLSVPWHSSREVTSRSLWSLSHVKHFFYKLYRKSGRI